MITHFISPNIITPDIKTSILDALTTIDKQHILPECWGNAYNNWKYVRQHEETENGNPGIFATIDLPTQLLNITNDVICETFGITTQDIYRPDLYCRVSEYTAPQCIPPHRDRPSYCEWTWLTVLNDDFTGGTFILDGTPIALNPGELLIFNNRLIHEVTPIITGVRLAAFSKFKIIQ